MQTETLALGNLTWDDCMSLKTVNASAFPILPAMGSPLLIEGKKYRVAGFLGLDWKKGVGVTVLLRSEPSG